MLLHPRYNRLQALRELYLRSLSEHIVDCVERLTPSDDILPQLRRLCLSSLGFENKKALPAFIRVCRNLEHICIHDTAIEPNQENDWGVWYDVWSSMRSLTALQSVEMTYLRLGCGYGFEPQILHDSASSPGYERYEYLMPLLKQFIVHRAPWSKELAEHLYKPVEEE